MPLGLPLGVVAWFVRAYHGGVSGITGALRAVSAHTGIPVVLVAALALVISYRVVRRSARLAVEVAFALALVVAATKLGWIHW